MVAQGFSLVELLLVLALIIIVSIFFIPNQQFFHHKTNNQLIRQQLFDAIQLTRQQSLVRAATVTLCPSDDYKTCSNHWSHGCLVFLDENKNGVVADVSKILAVFQFPKQRGEIHWQSFPRNRVYLQFTATGGTYEENGTFWYCDGNEFPVLAMVVSKSGRVRVVVAEGDGKVVDEEGNALSCK